MRRLLGVYVGASRQQSAHGTNVTSPRASHQRRLAVQQCRVRIRAGREQLLDHDRAAIHAGQVDRGDPGVVGRADPRTRVNQRVCHAHVVEVDRPMEGRRAVPLRRIDVDVLREQGAHRIGIPVLDGVDEAEIAGGGGVE